MAGCGDENLHPAPNAWHKPPDDGHLRALLLRPVEAPAARLGWRIERRTARNLVTNRIVAVNLTLRSDYVGDRRERPV